MKIAFLQGIPSRARSMFVDGRYLPPEVPLFAVSHVQQNRISAAVALECMDAPFEDVELGTAPLLIVCAGVAQCCQH